MKKRLLALVLSAVLALSLAACGSSKGDGGNAGAGSAAGEGQYTETYEWNVAITFGEPATRNILAMLDEVTEKTNGRMTFNVYPSCSLVGINEIPDAVRDGIAEITLVPTCNYPSIFTYTGELTGMPFSGITSPDQACELWHALYDEFPEMQEEFDAVNGLPWYIYATPQYHVLTSGTDEIRTPEDLKGHKIMTVKTQWLELINEYGGVGIQQFPNTYYESVEKGVADGFVQSYTTTRSFGLLELINTSTEFSDEGGFYDIFVLTINQDAWNELDPEVQQAFLDVNVDNAADKLENARSMADNDTAISELNEGFNRVILTDEEVKAWEDAMAPINEEHIKTLTETYKKDKVQEMYDWMLNWLDEQNN